MISTLFTSILAIWLLILSARVIALRGTSFLKFFAFNNFGEKALSRSNIVCPSPHSRYDDLFCYI